MGRCAAGNNTGCAMRPPSLQATSPLLAPAPSRRCRPPRPSACATCAPCSAARLSLPTTAALPWGAGYRTPTKTTSRESVGAPVSLLSVSTCGLDMECSWRVVGWRTRHTTWALSVKCQAASILTKHPFAQSSAPSGVVPVWPALRLLTVAAFAPPSLPQAPTTPPPSCGAHPSCPWAGCGALGHAWTEAASTQCPWPATRR